MNQLLTIKQASIWASDYLKKNISEANIAYLIQYGKVKKYKDNGSTSINIDDLKSYYLSYNSYREIAWKQKLGNDLNWELSFDNYKESETTKHVHRLHPYKGKFIPQLVEYFLDSHTDNYKKNIYFQPGDIVLDPFCGSGTTLVQANEFGIHSIGIDVSRFNSLISEVKLHNYDFGLLKKIFNEVKNELIDFQSEKGIVLLEKELNQEIWKLNAKYFPIKKQDNDHIGSIKEKEIVSFYEKLITKYDLKIKQENNRSFLDKWYLNSIRQEIDFVFSIIKNEPDKSLKKILAIILSRTIRSCRATTHSDLATLKEPQIKPYYCYKHKKICKPLFTIKYWFSRYIDDTFNRLQRYSGLKSKAMWATITADSRTVNIVKEVEKVNKAFLEILNKKKIQGIFTSPPYVGQIDYHEQHAYAYDLFGFQRKDELEIGSLYKGQGKEAQLSYIEGVAQVLVNCKKYLNSNPEIFIVANDKYNLYPEIAEKAGLKIFNQYKRPVLNRTERDKSPYSEIIFHFKYDYKSR